MGSPDMRRNSSNGAEPVGDVDVPFLARSKRNPSTDLTPEDDDDFDVLSPPANGGERLRDGGTHLLDLVAAVDHLSRGLRHDFTVWDALEEAVRWWLTDADALDAGVAPHDDLRSGEHDPLRQQLAQLVRHPDKDPTTNAADALQQAVRRWAATMADRYNAGYHWPHPAERRPFPPPLLEQ